MTSTPRVLSVQVGRPRQVRWHGRAVVTSIWKDPVTGPVRAGALNLEGDEQSDLSVHGGPAKAIYAYPSEHYGFWRNELPGIDLPWGAFGENLTIAGLLEGDVRIGDRLRIGSVELAVTQPRMPCYKLGIRFGRDDMVERFLDSGRSGFYLSVIDQGVLAAGDTIALDPRASHDITIADVAAAYATGGEDRTLLGRILDVDELPERLHEHFATLASRG